MKFRIGRNYTNKYNFFNQVSLVTIECFGYPINTPLSRRVYDNVEEHQFDEITKGKLETIKRSLEEAKLAEDFAECKRLKIDENKVKVIGKRIYEIEQQKRVLVENEDFEGARLLKIEIDRLKGHLRLLNDKFNNMNLVEERKGYTEREKQGDVMIETKEEVRDDAKEDRKNLSFTERGELSVIENHHEALNKTEFGNLDFNMSYEDQVIPALRRKMNNLSKDKIEEEEEPASELEEPDEYLFKQFESFIPIIGEENTKKMLSRQMRYKEEGIKVVLNSVDKFFGAADNKTIVDALMKLLDILLAEKNPMLQLDSLDLFSKITQVVQSKNIKLSFEFCLSDNLLIKIKEKVADVNNRVREKAVGLYTAMLESPVCDYKTLIVELLSEVNSVEVLKPNMSLIAITSNLVIIQHVLKTYTSAISKGYVTEKSFPYHYIAKYITSRVNHPKANIRKTVRSLLFEMYRIFGYKQLEQYLFKVDYRELIKISKKMPELNEYLNRKRAKSNASDRKASESPDKGIHCNSCRSKMVFKTEEELKAHHEKDCVMFVKCAYCDTLLEVKNFNRHLLKDCSKKGNFKECKRCKEPIEIDLYKLHVEENGCEPAKNLNVANRCPLCHRDVQPHERGWVFHLTKEKCKLHNRKFK